MKYLILILLVSLTEYPQDETQVKSDKLHNNSFLSRIIMVDKVPTGNYCVMKIKLDKSFDEIETAKLYREIYSNSSLIYTRILASLLSSLGAIDQSVKRMAFPSESLTLFVTIDGEPAVLTISSEKGIRFHFNESSSDSKKTTEFLSSYSSYIKSIRSQIEGNQLEFDKLDSSDPALYWENIVKSAKSLNESANIGLLVIE